MIGITSFGAYIPRYRLERKLIQEQMAWYSAGFSKGEKAMANYDEDTVTMAVSAAQNALSNVNRSRIHGVTLASMSLPFANRQSAGIVADALTLKRNIRTMDTTSSLRCGVDALVAGLEQVRDGEDYMVCASDARRAQPGSAQEYMFGDAAAAFVVGADKVLAEYKGSFSLHSDFQDCRRLADEEYEHSWEERWIRDKGYTGILPEAVKGLCEKYGVKIDSFTQIILPVPNLGAWKAAGKAVGAQPEQLTDTLLVPVGDTGAANALLMLCLALDQAKPGDNLLLTGYGYGATAVWFQATDALPEVRENLKGVAAQLSRRKAMPTYARYLAYKNLLPIELGIRGESVSPTAMTVLERLGSSIQALEGGRCPDCGTPQFPPREFCAACGSHKRMEPYSFQDKKGCVASFTGDYLAFSMDPPQHYGMVDFEGGGRLYMEYTDCVTEELFVGCPVELTFRVKHSDPKRGVIHYFWKAIPVGKEDSDHGEGN